MIQNMPNAGCLTGRFQPFHLDHLELFLQIARSHELVYVAITNPTIESRTFESTNPDRHLPESNPFSFEERVQFVELVAKEFGIDSRRVITVPFSLTEQSSWHSQVPLETLQYVRVYSPWEEHKVNVLSQKYQVKMLMGNTTVRPIRATSIRMAMKTGCPWTHLVPSCVSTAILRERQA